jgi:hypothetical protein
MASGGYAGEVPEELTIAEEETQTNKGRVRALDGTDIQVTTSCGAPVGDLRRELAKLQDIDEDQVKLVFEERVLESSDVVPNGIVQCVIKAQAVPCAETVADDSLEAIEASLTGNVPSLLEAMNAASTEVNQLETDAAIAQQQYQQFLLEWTGLAEDMRAKHGQSFDLARPYFEAAHKVRVASQRAQGIVRTFSAASSQCNQAKLDLRKIEEQLGYGAHNLSLDWEQQEGLSRATVHALKSQQERDRCEGEYAKALQEYEEAKAVAARCKAEGGDALIRRMVPCFRQLQTTQQHLAERQRRVNALQERIRVAKNIYHQSMKGLEDISTAVHNARKEHAAQTKTSAAKKALNKILDCSDSCPEQDHPVAESAEAFAFGDSLKSPENGQTNRFHTVPEVINNCPFA